jgi:hypothetical protein
LLRSIDSLPVILQNATRIRTVRIQNPIGEADPLLTDEFDKLSLPLPLFRGSIYLTTAKLPNPNGSDSLGRNIIKSDFPAVEEIVQKIGEGKPGLIKDPRTILMRGIDQLLGDTQAYRVVFNAF